MDDMEENIEEFKSNDNSNRQNIKNPSLMTSIALNSCKHLENAKDFKFGITDNSISQQQNRNSQENLVSTDRDNMRKTESNNEIIKKINTNAIK